MEQLTIGQAMQAAFSHQQSGRLAEAEGIYRQVLACCPDHADALHLLGILAGLRRRMRESPLMDAPRFARGVEAAYHIMWRRWCAGSPPEDMGSG
jgi:hypothetical protein